MCRAPPASPGAAALSQTDGAVRPARPNPLRASSPTLPAAAASLQAFGTWGMVVRYDQPDSGLPAASRPVANGCGDVMPGSLQQRTSLFSGFCAQVAALLESDQQTQQCLEARRQARRQMGGMTLGPRKTRYAKS